MLSIYSVATLIDGKSQQIKKIVEVDNYHLRNFNHALNSRLADLEVTAQLLSAMVFSDQYPDEIPTKKIIGEIGSSWENINDGMHLLQMIYYSSSHDYLESWGVWSNDSGMILNDEPDIGEGSPKNKDSIMESIQGISFFSCAEVCYINHARALSSYNQSSDQGYLVIRYPIIAIVDELALLRPLVSVLSYKGHAIDSDFFFYDNEKYIISDASGVASSEDIISKALNAKKTTGSGEVSIDNKLIHYSLFDTNSEIENRINLKIIFFTDITESSNELYIRNLTTFSFLVFSLLLTMSLILFFLNKPMKSLSDIAKVMPMIGDGDFLEANNSLHKISKNITTDEIRAINDITIKLSEDLKKAHAEIMISLEYKSERYDFIQQLIDTSPAIFITYDNNYKILLSNKYAENLLGMKREEINGLDFITLFNFDKNNADGHDDSASSFNTLILDSNNNERMFSWMKTIFTSHLNHQSQTICVGIDTTYRLKLENDIRFIAEHDELTGLFNRRKIDEVINQNIENLQPLYLLYIDVNHFKLVNDTLGHQAGDQLLIDLSRMLERTVAHRGIVGRTGGDEFSIVLFTNDQSTAQLVCEELITSSNAIGAALGNQRGLPARVSLSIGLVTFPENASTLEALYSKADAAMYENKIHRTGSYHFFTGNETLIKEMRVRKYWEDLIKESIKNNNILPYFQGIHDKNNTDKICFYEILCRVKYDGEVFSAHKFIDEISHLPLLREIDELMLHAAIQFGSKLNEKPSFMINFSALSIASLSNQQDHSDFFNSIDYPLDKIVIEITEQLAVKDINKTISLMNLFKKRGIRFALDDFGTGYSSLSYLRQMPFDFLKIDKTFIAESIKDTQSLSFLKSIIELVRGLELKIIVEGIETSDLLNLADDLEVDFLQGYYLSKPQQKVVTPSLSLCTTSNTSI